jgi:hypothetical protein
MRHGGHRIVVSCMADAAAKLWSARRESGPVAWHYIHYLPANITASKASMLSKLYCTLKIAGHDDCGLTFLAPLDVSFLLLDLCTVLCLWCFLFPEVWGEDIIAYSVLSSDTNTTCMPPWLGRLKQSKLGEYLINGSRKSRLMAMGIRCTDHATPIYSQEVGINFADKRRSLSLYTSLAHWSHGVVVYMIKVFEINYFRLTISFLFFRESKSLRWFKEGG